MMPSQIPELYLQFLIVLPEVRRMEPGGPFRHGQGVASLGTTRTIPVIMRIGALKIALLARHKLSMVGSHSTRVKISKASLSESIKRDGKKTNGKTNPVGISTLRVIDNI